MRTERYKLEMMKLLREELIGGPPDLSFSKVSKYGLGALLARPICLFVVRLTQPLGLEILKLNEKRPRLRNIR